MDTTIATTRGLPRLNPFAFRSDTDSRFVLLIISVLGSSLVFFNALAVTLPFLHQQVVVWYHCALEFQRVRPANYTDHYAYINALEAANTTYERCSSSFLFMLSALSFGGVALVLAVAAGIYWSFPIWKLRRGKLVPLSREDAPEVVDYLSNLCREVGLTSHPRFVWNPLNLTSGALAFGRLRRYYVALSGGLVTQFYTDQPAFRAIVLHELAHLRNADVDKTYFTVAIWWAFVAVALVPFVVIGLFQSSLAVTFDLGLRVLPLTVLVYLTRNAVLRAREYYADVRASTWNGSGALSRVLKALPHSRQGWQATVSVHPDPDERCQVLDETQRLFRLNFWEAFGVGVAVTIAFSNIQTLAGLIGSLTGIQPIDYLTLELLVPAIIFAPIIVGVLGLNTWRATFAKIARDEAPDAAGLLGLSLGFGLILGRFLLLSPQSLPGLTDLATLIYDLPWNVLLLIGLFFFFRWIAAGASVWLEIAAARRSPRLIYTSGLIIASVVLIIGLEHLFSYRDLSSLDLSQGISSVSNPFTDSIEYFWLVTLGQLTTLLALMCLWVFPLAASFWRRRMARAATSSWAFLDSPSQYAGLPLQEPLRPRLALMIGLVGGLLYCILLLLIQIWRHSNLSAAITNTDQFIQWFTYGRFVGGAILQAIIAAIVAVWVRRLGVLYGLFAAFVAGCVMTAGVCGSVLLYGQTIDFFFVWNVLGWIVNGGAILALLTAPVVSALAGWIRRLQHETLPDDIRFQQSLSENVAEWEQRKRPRDLLYRGAQLKEAQKWARRNMPSEQEAAFLRASAAQRILSIVGVIVVALLLISSLGVTGWYVFSQPSKTLVTTLQDSDTVAGSLRWGIDNAPSGSTIRFAQGLRGIIELTGGGLVFADGKQLTIAGPGANRLTISGSNKNAIIHVSRDAIVAISGLSFKNSETVNDAFLFNEGTLTMTNSVISDNKTTAGATSFGGGIFNRGTLSVINSTISGNTADGDGSGQGGGIDNEGQLTVTNSIIQDNKAYSSPGRSFGGGILNFSTGTLMVTDSTFSGNSSTGGKQYGEGGGIVNEGKLTVTGSTFSHNSANSSPGSSFGGGIVNFSTGTLMVTDSTFSGNSANGMQYGQGGGIDNEGKLTVTGSTFSNNTASGSSNTDYGGGIVNYSTGTLMVSTSTFSDNSASGDQNGQGGGIDNDGKLTLISSTFSGNSATGKQGSFGGGIFYFGFKGSSVIIRFCTIYKNTSSAGGGIWVDPKGNSHITIGSSIVAANSAYDGPDISGALISGGYNLLENVAGATGLNARTDRQVTLADLKIDSTLRDSGGSTKTLALLPGSPAIDAVPLQACSITVTDTSGQNETITTDQRGDPRPDGSENACDIGAYESSY